jgi:hypothetical protein
LPRRAALVVWWVRGRREHVHHFVHHLKLSTINQDQSFPFI